MAQPGSPDPGPHCRDRGIRRAQVVLPWLSRERQIQTMAAGSDDPAGAGHPPMARPGSPDPGPHCRDRGIRRKQVVLPWLSRERQIQTMAPFHVPPTTSVPLRARGVSASIGKGQERLKNDCNCAGRAIIQSASADFGYQPWNSFLGGRAVAPGIRTLCQMNLEKGNSAHSKQAPATRTNAPTQCLYMILLANWYSRGRRLVVRASAR